jgi:di/tricarboxylate transporter
MSSDLPIERNVGGRDRAFRAVTGVVAALVAVAAARRGKRALAAVVGAAATGLLFNAVACFCGVNAWLGIDTTDD